MKKLVSLLTGMLFICFTSISAQDILKVDGIDIVNSNAGNVIVQIEITDQNQAISSRIIATNANGKAGFTPVFNEDDAVLTLNFTEKFNQDELFTLLEYSGIELNIADFKQLYYLLNQ